jgi:hypothetical protein
MVSERCESLEEVHEGKGVVVRDGGDGFVTVVGCNERWGRHIGDRASFA